MNDLNKPIPIVLDTDPGVDDFFCIALAATFTDIFDLKALTTIGGNNYTDVTTKNALDILKLLNRQDVPVARGADSYLTKPFGEPVTKFHGANGLGNVVIEASDQPIDELPAYEKIYQEALKANGELVLVTVGPETNLALAFNKHPDLNKLLKRIVVMGGTLTTGNVSEYAEANIYHDAQAARIVFESGVPIDMIGLNVTRKAPLETSIFDDIPNMNPIIKDVMEKLIIFKHPDSMHDAIAISSLISDDIITFKETYTYIIDDEGEKHGMSATDDNKTANSRVAVDINVENYYEVIKEMLRHYTI